MAKPPEDAELAYVLGVPHYGGGPDQLRYSPLTQITRANVRTLRVAWTYESGFDQPSA